MIVLCDRMNTESSWSEGDCYNHLKAYDSCKSEFIDVFTCILVPPPIFAGQLMRRYMNSCINDVLLIILPQGNALKRMAV